MQGWNLEEIGWISGLTLLTFFGTLIAIPLLVVRIPSDYFVRPRSLHRTRHPAVHVTLIVLKNLLGLVLTVAGFAMLVLPGQGVLTILLGVMLLDFPGKRAFERWLVSRPRVFDAVNWMRRRAHHPPLERPTGRSEASANH